MKDRPGPRVVGPRVVAVQAITLTALLVCTCRVSGQDAGERPAILRDLSCECIVLGEVFRVGDLNGPDGIGPTFAMTRSPITGDYWYSSNRSRGEILTFDSAGAQIGKKGRWGEGPGEFKWIMQLHARGPDLHAIDIVNMRWTTLGSDARSVETRRIRAPAFASALVDDTLLVANMDLRTRELTGLPLHLVGPSGAILHSFGKAPDGYRSEPSDGVMRQLTPSGSRHVWTASPDEYRLERWSITGERDLELRRSVDWFEPHHGGMLADPDVPPNPWIVDLQEDQEGLLWVMILVADDTWFEGLEPLRETTEASRFTWKPDRSEFLDTVLEVIDPGARTVVARGRWDFSANGFVDGEHLAVYRETEVGVPTVEVWRFELLRSEMTRRRRR